MNCQRGLQFFREEETGATAVETSISILPLLLIMLLFFFTTVLFNSYSIALNNVFLASFYGESDAGREDFALDAGSAIPEIVIYPGDSEIKSEIVAAAEGGNFFDVADNTHLAMANYGAALASLVGNNFLENEEEIPVKRPTSTIRIVRTGGNNVVTWEERHPWYESVRSSPLLGSNSAYAPISVTIRRRIRS